MKRRVGCLITCSLGLFAASCDTIRSNSPDEEILIDRALDLQAGPTEEGRAALLSMAVPIVVTLPDMDCVAFKLKRNAIGGESVVCFSRADGSVVINHTEGM